MQIQQQQVSMDNVTVMTAEKEMMGHVKVVMPLFHSTKAQLALKHWPTALKQQVANSTEMNWLCYSVLMKFKTRKRGNTEVNTLKQQQHPKCNIGVQHTCRAHLCIAYVISRAC